MGRLKGKVVVITGTGDGMGRTAALRFAQEGAAIVGCDINPETAEETLEQVRAAGGKMESLHPLDLTVEAETGRLMALAEDAFGDIDVLYNNAMGMKAGTPLNMTRDSFDWTFANTLTLGWLATKHAAPRMRAGGSVIFIGAHGGQFSSGTAMPGNIPIVFAYLAAKAAVIRLSGLMAIDLASRDIRVNCISPGPIATPVARDLYGSPDALLYEENLGQLLVGRIGEPEDIVNAAVYLASDEAGFVTGVNLVVDGGLTASQGQGRRDPEIGATIDRAYSGWLNDEPTDVEGPR